MTSEIRAKAMENGTRYVSRTVWWVLGAVFSLLVAIGGFSYADIQGEITHISRLQALHGERISVVETQLLAVNRRLDDIGVRLDRIEQKLDRLIDEQRRRP